MKRIISIVLLAILCMTYVSAFADQKEAITFRGIDWYTNANDVNATLKAIEGVTAGSKNDMAGMQGWFRKWEYSNTNEYVAESGVIQYYSSVPVAGYSAELATYLMYPIVNGKVEYDSNKAEFYMAYYTIKGFEDLYAVFTDLQNKLDKTYGAHVDKSYSGGGAEGVLWTAQDGSLVWLMIRQNTVYKNYEYIQLTYFAPNGVDRLNQLAAQIHQEAVDAEKEEREKNADNYDGL